MTVKLINTAARLRRELKQEQPKEMQQQCYGKARTWAPKMTKQSLT